MKCPNCGTENPGGRMVCRNCGRRLRSGPQAADAAWQSVEDLMPRLKADMLRLVIVFAIVIAVGLTLGYLTR